MLNQTIHPHAFHAIKAASLLPTIGRYAAMRYCQKRGVPLCLFTLARILRAAH